jgi:hypothetical protein
VEGSSSWLRRGARGDRFVSRPELAVRLILRRLVEGGVHVDVEAVGVELVVRRLGEIVVGDLQECCTATESVLPIHLVTTYMGKCSASSVSRVEHMF